jgi:hypothetical protein
MGNVIKDEEYSDDVRIGCIQIFNLLLKQSKSNEEPKSSASTKNKYFGKCLSKVKI